MKHAGLLSFCLVAVLFSCSSDDGQEQNAEGRKHRELTISEVPMTRATLTDNTSALGAAWNAGDNATYFNVSTFDETNMDYGVLTASSSGNTSAFQGAVCCTTGDKVALFYPAQVIPTAGENRGNFTLSLSEQKGTLADIAEHFHYVYGVAEVTSVTENTANATISNMQSLLAVCKFTFTDGTSTIPVYSLTINYYDNSSSTQMGYPLSATLEPKADAYALDYPDQSNWESNGGLKITLDTETSDGVYVALFPYEFTGNMHFSVTNSTGTYTGTAKAKVNAGKYYPVPLKLTKQNN